jgi:hypothetical protein
LLKVFATSPNRYCMKKYEIPSGPNHTLRQNMRRLISSGDRIESLVDGPHMVPGGELVRDDVHATGR